MAFFGFHTAFDYGSIGGTNSFARRIALHLCQQGDIIDYITFGASEKGSRNIAPGCTLKKFISFREALTEILKSYDHVVVIYLPFWTRLEFLKFRTQHHTSTNFHSALFSWPDSVIKRQLNFLDSSLFYESVFVVSPRLKRAAQRLHVPAILLLPPVPNNYFLNLPQKSVRGMLKVTYIGRTEPEKGISSVLETFDRLNNYPQIEMSIYGYHWPDSEQSVKMHRLLLDQNKIQYKHIPYEGYSNRAEESIRTVLRKTDILLLPYQKISSTIDTPLLLLEGMASLCAIITKPLGDIQEIYGSSRFLLTETDWLGQIENLVTNSSDLIAAERERIFNRNRTLEFDTSKIAEQFKQSLQRE